MKVIIAGSRDITNYKIVEQAIKDSGFKITEVVSGCAKGVDKLGEEYADHKMLPVKKFPAKWKDMSQPCIIAENQYGPYNKLAGINRNKEMGKYSDALVVVTNGSDGTQNMIETAKELGLMVYIHKIEG
jgi:hypothetical protein